MCEWTNTSMSAKINNSHMIQSIFSIYSMLSNDQNQWIEYIRESKKRRNKWNTEVVNHVCLKYKLFFGEINSIYAHPDYFIAYDQPLRFVQLVCMSLLTMCSGFGLIRNIQMEHICFLWKYSRYKIIAPR